MNTGRAHHSSLPPETRWLLLFQSCNAVNFTVALGAPMVLLARHLGASEWHVGLLTGLAPFMACLQIMTTNVIDRLGFRRVMVLGWGLRAFTLLPIVPLPFLVGRVSPGVLVLGLMIPMLLFASIRGLAAGAWFPWLRALLPEEQRGHFLGLELRAINLSAFVAMIGSGLLLGSGQQPWRFGALFTIGWIAGILSAWFLSRMPDCRPPEHDVRRRKVSELLGYARRAWAHPPFRRSTRYIMVYMFAIAAVPAFLILFLNEELGWSKRDVLITQALIPIGMLITSVRFGRLADKAGSKPVLRLAGIGQLGCVFYWVLSAARVFPPGYADMALSFLLWGICGAGHAVSQVRMMLACSPQKDVTVSIAVFQVSVSATAGFSPLVTGWILGVLTRFESNSLPEGSAFAITFAASLAIGILAQVLLISVREEKAVPAHSLLVQTFYGWPMRVVSSFLVGGRRNGK